MEQRIRGNTSRTSTTDVNTFSPEFFLDGYGVGHSPQTRSFAPAAPLARVRLRGKPETDAYPLGRAGFTKFMEELILGRLYLGVNDYAPFTLLIGNEGIDVKVHDFRVI